MKRLALVLSVISLPSRASAPTVAMNAHLPSAQDAQLMAQLGVRTARLDVNWFDFEPQRGQWNWGYLDAVFANARAQGLGLYASIGYTPQWASSSPGCTQFAASDATKCENKRPANVQDWRNAVTAVVTRFRGKVDCWGIWNEPNLRTFFDGTQDEFVNEIFLPAAAAIRAADPSAKICGPELSGLASGSNWNGNKGTCAFGGCIRNGWERDLGELLTRVGSHIDIITHHTYQSDAAGVMKAVLDGETVAGLLTHDSIKRVIEVNGGAGKEFWLTETGWEHPPQGGVSLPDVATRIVDLYAKQEEVCAGTYAASLVDPWRNWTRTFYFHFPYDPGSGWGIVDQNGGALPPYSALQNWTRGRTTTACVFGLTAVPDAGVPAADAGRPEAGPADAGRVMSDAGSLVDAGPPTGEARDAGAEVPGDAGGGTSSAPDAGPPEVGGREPGDPPPGTEPAPARLATTGGCTSIVAIEPEALLTLVLIAHARRTRRGAAAHHPPAEV